ncbi:hypothetical protein IWX49DRAFT_551681 [Phyllosticta citricarpa]|uniref:Uncharacterized protein n=1 Tax=Phyllosticta citricarpa TaxID=55181 RepID=A0ABR1ME13_9PEZI
MVRAATRKSSITLNPSFQSCGHTDAKPCDGTSSPAPHFVPAPSAPGIADLREPPTSEQRQRNAAPIAAVNKVSAIKAQSPEISRCSKRDIKFLADKKKLRKEQFSSEQKQRRRDSDKWNKQRYYNEWEAKVGLRNNGPTTAGGLDENERKRIDLSRLRLTNFFHNIDHANMSL